MHVTPLRSSRALALRFLANKFGLDMTNFTVPPPPSVTWQEVWHLSLSFCYRITLEAHQIMASHPHCAHSLGSRSFGQKLLPKMLPQHSR